MTPVIVILLIVVVLAAILVASSARMVQQFEQGVVLRFGRLRPHLREPGLTLIAPFADRMVKVNRQIVVLPIPAQGAITRDNVTLTVDAVVYFKVVDPVRATINVENYLQATSQVAQTSLRSVIGRAELDTLLSDRNQINDELKGVIDAPTEEWGIAIERVEVKDIELPEGMKRSMSRQAEAERDRRARVIDADGEFQASTKLSQAAAAMSDTPGALQLRLLQTVTDVAAEKNSTLVMPFPVELLRFFDRVTEAATPAQEAPTPAQQAPTAPTLPTAATLPGAPGLPTAAPTGPDLPRASTNGRAVPDSRDERTGL